MKSDGGQTLLYSEDRVGDKKKGGGAISSIRKNDWWYDSRDFANVSSILCQKKIAEFCVQACGSASYKHM